MLVQRMLRAARLDPEVYYELERDRSANGQAFLVVLLVLACGILGTAGITGLLYFLTPMGWGPLIEILAMTIGNWLFWTYIAVLVGARYGSRADFEQVMRPVGFAATPGLLWLLAFIPGLALPIGGVVLIWTCVARIVAVRESMRLTLGKAVLTAVVTTVIIWVINVVMAFVMGGSTSLVRIILSPLGR